jgi:hypothetical protein
MAIDQRDVSSKLRFMDDRALQQYAAMHKSDPYIFPLAFQESQNRQKLRMQQQAQAGAQPQPKVADQALAQMVPEDRGIATLPAPNMQGMADGGIAGYEGYGEEPRQFGQESVLRMAEGGVARYQTGGSIQSRYQQESMEMGMGTRMQYSPEVQAYAQAQEAESKSSYAERERQRMLRGPYADAAPAAPVATMPEPGYTRPGMKGDPRLNTPRPTPVSAPTVDAAPKADTTRKTEPSKDAAPARTKASEGLASLDIEKMTNEALDAAEKRPNPFAKEQAAIGKEQVAAKEAEVAGLQAIQDKFSDIFKGRKERLDTKDKDIVKMDKQFLGLAFLEAGADMMRTRGSIGEAIGAGVKAGSKQYVAGLDKINSAKDKLSDARDRLEEIEAQRGEMSARELLKARNEVKNAEIKAKEDMVKANMQMYGINREQALKIVDNKVKVATTIYEQQNANSRVAAGENAKLNFYRELGKAPEGSALQKGFQMSKQEGAEPTMYANYVKMSTDPMNGEAFLKKYPTFDVYKAGMGGGMQFAAPPADATVLSKPKS